MPCHRLTGPKYAYFDELVPYLDRGQSLVVYHHLHRSLAHESQVRDRLSQVEERLGPAFALRFRPGTGRAFFVVPAEAHRVVPRERALPWCGTAAGLSISSFTSRRVPNREGAAASSAVAIPRPSKTIRPMERGRAPWVPRRSETEHRRARCELLYDVETELRKVGWGDPAYVHDEESGMFRFRDGRFAFSREHADWALFRKRDRL